jgi:hypothetical protein
MSNPFAKCIAANDAERAAAKERWLAKIQRQADLAADLAFLVLKLALGESCLAQLLNGEPPEIEPDSIVGKAFRDGKPWGAKIFSASLPSEWARNNRHPSDIYFAGTTEAGELIPPTPENNGVPLAQLILGPKRGPKPTKGKLPTRTFAKLMYEWDHYDPQKTLVRSLQQLAKEKDLPEIPLSFQQLLLKIAAPLLLSPNSQILVAQNKHRVDVLFIYNKAALLHPRRDEHAHHLGAAKGGGAPPDDSAAVADDSAPPDDSAVAVAVGSAAVAVGSAAVADDSAW